MQKQFKYPLAACAVAGVFAALVFSQQQKPTFEIKVNPPEPIATGSCTASTSGYLDLNGKTEGFTDEEFGKMIMPALRQGYVLTIYPPTKRGIFVNQECHGSNK